MEYRKLGNSGLEVSKICLGTMTFGQQNSEEQAHEQLDYALSRDVNFLDTAELYAVPSAEKTYGLTEKYIGSWLKHQDRKRLIVASKIAGPSGMSYMRSVLDFSNDSIDYALGKSLERLQTDYIDLYQLHWPERKNNRFGVRGMNQIKNDAWEDNFLEVINKLSTLINQGLIRTWGLSNETPWGVMRILQLCDTNNLPRPVSIQNPYSLLNRTYEYGLAEVSLRENIGLLAYSPLAMGLLTGKYDNGSEDPSFRLNLFKNQWGRYIGHHKYEIAKQYNDLAAEFKLSPTSMSLGFVNDRDFTTSNIFGATTMKQLKENIDSAEVKLSLENLKKIDEIHELKPNPAP